MFPNSRYATDQKWSRPKLQQHQIPFSCSSSLWRWSLRFLDPTEGTFNKLRLKNRWKKKVKTPISFVLLDSHIKATRLNPGSHEDHKTRLSQIREVENHHFTSFKRCSYLAVVKFNLNNVPEMIVTDIWEPGLMCGGNITHNSEEGPPLSSFSADDFPAA